MSNLLESYLQLLNERPKRTSRSVISRQTKINKSASQMGTAQARKKNDSLYKQMKFYCEKCTEYRDKIHKKYSSRNKSRANR